MSIDDLRREVFVFVVVVLSQALHTYVYEPGTVQLFSVSDGVFFSPFVLLQGPVILRKKILTTTVPFIALTHIRTPARPQTQ